MHHESIKILLERKFPFKKNIDEVKFPKPWIEHALERGYVDNSVYKKHLTHKESDSQRMKGEIREMKIKKLDLLGKELDCMV